MRTPVPGWPESGSYPSDGSAEPRTWDAGTAESLERGKRLFERGAVASVKVSGGAVIAYVADTERYRVTASLLSGGAKRDCTCKKNACEHIAAVLLYVSQNPDSIRTGRTKRGPGVKSILKNASAESLREFLELAMKRDKDLRSQFMAYHGVKGNRNYREEIDRVYARGYRSDGYYARVNLGPFFKTAKAMANGAGYAEALRIYAAMADAVESNMEKIDDAEARYDNYFAKAAEGMADCINGQKLEHGQKRQHISHLFDLAKSDAPYFIEYCADALKNVCTDRQDLLYWKGLLEPILADRMRRKRDISNETLTSMQIHILDKLGDPSCGEAYLKNYRSNIHVCLQYIEYLKGSDLDRAKSVADEGIGMFPCRAMLDAALQLYHDGEPRRVILLETLFCSTDMWSYYNSLTKSSDNRQDAVESVLDRLRRMGNLKTLVGVLLREGHNDRAVSEVVSAGSLDLLGTYHDPLCMQYPDRYYAAYRKLLEGADPGRDGKDYRRFGDHLRLMKSVPGHVFEFQKFIDSIRKEFPRRPALLAELDSV